MTTASSWPAVPPQLTAAGREPNDDADRGDRIWAYVALLVLLAFLAAAAIGAAWLWGLIRR